MSPDFPIWSAPFYFVRHGVTDHNLARVIMGQLDVPLNDKGRQQARRAAVVVARLGIAAIYASPLVRALETAQILAEAVGLSITVMDDLKERNWGTLAGRSHRERRLDVTPPGAETPEIFAARTVGALQTIVGPGPVLVVAHSGTCRVLRRACRIDDGEGPVPNAVPLRFEPVAGGRWREVSLAVAKT